MLYVRQLLAGEVDNGYFELSMKLECHLIVQTNVLLSLCRILFCVLKVKGCDFYVMLIYVGTTRRLFFYILV